MLLTEQEIDSLLQGPSQTYREYARAIEVKVIEKIKAQGAAAWAATSDDGTVEALGFNQSKSRFTVPLYQLPGGD